MIDPEYTQPEFAATLPVEPDEFAVPVPLKQKPTLRRLFLGDDGLRAGWSILLFILLGVAFTRLIGFAIAHFHLLPKAVPGRPAPMTARIAAIGDGLGFAAFAFVAFLMSLVERRSFSRYGLSMRRMPTDALMGLFWGVALLSALIGALYATHTLAFDGVLLHGQPAFSYAAKWALGFFCVGLFEEFLTRGYIQYTVARGVAGITRAVDPLNRHAHLIGFWVAALLFSVLLFMAGHLGNHGESAAGIIAVGEAGAVFAFSLYRTGTLWWAIGFHTAWDWAQTFFYGVSDSGLAGTNHVLGTHPIGSAFVSGGSVGPEGSILVLPTLLLAALVIHFTLPRRDYPLTHDQQKPQTVLAL